MARTYTLDTKAASAADQTVSLIRETGKYIGTITRAEAISSDSGTEGVELSFRSREGATADYLTLWTYNASGEALPSLKALNALMTVCKARAITPTAGLVEKWDPNARARLKVQATIYPELTGKEVGLLLQREEYIKRDSSTGDKLNVFGVFDPITELTASEILAQKTNPETLAKMVAVLRDKPAKAARPRTAAPAQQGGFHDMDDDIPF